MYMLLNHIFNLMCLWVLICYWGVFLDRNFKVDFCLSQTEMMHCIFFHYYSREFYGKLFVIHCFANPLVKKVVIKFLYY